MAVRVAEVTPALKEAVNDIAWGRAREGNLKVVEAGKGCGVHNGGQNGVNVGLIGSAGAVFELRAADVYERV